VFCRICAPRWMRAADAAPHSCVCRVFRVVFSWCLGCVWAVWLVLWELVRLGHSVDAGGARLSTSLGVAVFSCSVLQHVAVCCSALQCVAVCCSMLQCVAVCCSMLQCVAAREELLHEGDAQCVAVFTQSRSVLQCVAAWCSVLQHVAVCCSTRRSLA